MSELSSPSSDVRRQALLEAIDAADRAARRGQTRFWLLSGSWALVIIVLSVLFVRGIDRLETESARFSSQIGELEARVRVSLTQAETARQETRELRDNLADLNRSLIQVANLNFDNLPEGDRNNLGTRLAEQQIQRRGTESGGALSSAEQAFLGKFGDDAQRIPMRSAEAAYRSGTAALLAGDNQTAAGHFEEALSGFDTPYLPAYLGLGRALFETGRFEDARDAFTKSVDTANNASARVWRARTSLKLAKLADASETDELLLSALQDCDEAIRLSPEYWYSYNTRGFSNLLLGNYDDAVSDWHDAGARSNDPAYALENVGLAYVAGNRWQEALEYTGEFIETYGVDSAWNWLPRVIAADKLGLDAEANTARERWDAIKLANDVETLRGYLPADLHSYLD